MKVLFTSLSGYGHTFPLLPLARACVARGDAVTFATCGDVHPLLARLGMTPAAAGITMAEGFARAAADLGVDISDKRNPDAFKAVGRAFGDVLPAAHAHAHLDLIDKVRPDLVVYEVVNPGAAVAARARGVPTVCHAISRRSRLVDIVPHVGDRVARLAEEFGVPGLDLDVDPYADIYPGSLQPEDAPVVRPDRRPLRPVAFDEPGSALPDWVAEHREPLVYLTLGTAFGNVGVLRRAVEGLSRLPVRVLVAAGPTVDTAALGVVPASVTVLPWVPQAAALRHADLVVHHGGSGTTLGSLAAGLPQLFLPQGADQFLNAEACTAAGAGRQLLDPGVGADDVEAAARALLDDADAVRAAAKLAAEVAAMPSPEEFAEDLAVIAG